MQEYRKLLCVNKIRETKRLIENMLIPILSLVVAAAVVGYQIVINFFPIIRKINACNLRICYMLLLGSIFAVFRLTLRSMVQQLDSILEKATDGLFIPISENRIVKQFMVIPITIVCGEGIIMAFVVNSSIAQILLGCAILICATVLNLWLEVKYKNFLVKKDFILSIAVFLGALILTK